MRIAIYARRSEGNDNAASVPDQIAACRAYIKQRGIVSKDVAIYADDGISGKRKDRPQYQRLLGDVAAARVEAVVVWKQDRLGRDMLEAESAIRRIESAKVRLLTTNGYDSHGMTKATRKMVRGFDAVMNQAYSDRLAEEVKRGQTRAARDGQWVGGLIYGYDLQPLTSDKELDAYGRPKQIGTKLVINKKQSAVVREIFERYGQGESPNAIAADLNARKVPSPGTRWRKRKVRRADGWARSCIWQMLHNERYTGAQYWNTTEWEWVEKTDEKTNEIRTVRVSRKLPRSEWVVRSDPKLRIVDDATWKRAQRRLSVNADRPKDHKLRGGGKVKYLLSGILRCECGAHFVLDSNTHYRCGKAADGKACPKSGGFRVRRDALEAAILGPINERLLSPTFVEEFRREFARYHAERVATMQKAAAQVPKEVAELDSRIERLRARLRAGDDPDMTTEDLEAAIDRAEARRAELLANRPEAKESAKVIALLPRAAETLRKQIADGLKGSSREAARARAVVRQLVGGDIKLARKAKSGDVVARIALCPRPLLVAAGGTVTGSVGSGGRI